MLRTEFTGKMQVIKWFNSKPSSILGVDVSSTSIKVLAISNARGKSRVEGYGYKLLPVIEGEINPMKEIDAVSSGLREILLQHNFFDYMAVTALPDSLVLSKVIQLSAKLNHSEIEEAVLIEADYYVAHPPNEISVDFKILGHCRTNSSMLDVLIVVAKTEQVTRRAEALKRAGLRVTSVDVESDAIGRSLRLITRQLLLQQGEIVVLISIGVSLIHFFVSDSSKILFIHEEILGDRQLFESVQKHDGPSYEHALPIDAGVFILSDAWALKIIQPVVEILLIGMQKIRQFLSSLAYQPVIVQILLAGNWASLAKIAERLQEKTTIPIQLANPLQYLVISKNLNAEVILNTGPSLMVACGLALRQGGCYYYERN
ncbi:MULTISPECIES: type IV pilus assembly protein PilM [unclassified Legionella]|uniref:type IV pilus assembly protein PilM n=1 Tax=unclassified Legionella TaxID=2622702 RepID=UPI001E444F4A|nr:type IV pilus assembly protein PilM [Legionella sp. 31fI33]MCC5016212.1 pilus assembly protein PilM [Legionella sp. 31fI33]